jgi:DNA-binding response OmpR family regulator
MEKNKKILLVEDDENNREAITALLEVNNYSVESAANGKEALKKLESEQFNLIITDLNMPIMNGEEFIAALGDSETNHVILVQTVLTDMSKAISLMRQGVYDYILKPYSNQEFLHRIKLALEVSELRALSRMVEKERQERMNKQLDWNLWKGRSLQKDTDQNDSTLIESIRTSLSQASGFGSMVSVLDLLQSRIQPEGEDKYIVPKRLLDMLFENGKIAKEILQTFEELDYLLQTEIEFSVLSLSSIYEIMNGLIKETESLQSLKNQTIKLGKNPFSGNKKMIRINRDFFERAIKELLLNAMKFSKPNTNIYVLPEVHQENLKISVLNAPAEDGKGSEGIPSQFQELVFEPFFRISKYVYEDYPSLDFGIGLTFVAKVARKHGGSVNASMVKSHLDAGENSQLVNIEFALPLHSE